LHISQQELAV